MAVATFALPACKSIPRLKLEKEKQELSQDLQTELESQGGFQGLWERFKVLIP